MTEDRSWFEPTHALDRINPSDPRCTCDCRMPPLRAFRAGQQMEARLISFEKTVKLAKTAIEKGQQRYEGVCEKCGQKHFGFSEIDTAAATEMVPS
jgi:hypothetical protein